MTIRSSQKGYFQLIFSFHITDQIRHKQIDPSYRQYNPQYIYVVSIHY